MSYKDMLEKMNSSDKWKGDFKRKATIKKNIKAINQLIPNVFVFTDTSIEKFIKYNDIS